MKITNLLMILSLLITLPALGEDRDGGRDSGGGFYGKVKGQWILLDDLEEGIILNPETEPFKSPLEKVKAIVAEIDGAAPEFANDLVAPLAKTWHLVDFEIICDKPESPLKIELSAGACQDENDVFIEKAKYESASPEQLIKHELVQGVRISKNKLRNPNEQISFADVRAVKRAITRGFYRDEAKFIVELEKYHFGRYDTFAQFEARQKREAYSDAKFQKIQKSKDSAMGLYLNACLKNYEIRNVQERADALTAIAKTQSALTDVLGEIETLKWDVDIGASEQSYLGVFDADVGGWKNQCNRKRDEVIKKEF